MTHIEGFLKAIAIRALASAAVLPSTLDPAQRAETINLLTFTALKADDEEKEQRNIF